MDIIRARKILRALAEGVDPTTGDVLLGESIYNQPEVIRALYTVLEVTDPKHQDPLRNAGKPWTKAEENVLREEYAGNMKIREIAMEHGRIYGAIESRLEHIGLKKRKRFWPFNRK